VIKLAHSKLYTWLHRSVSAFSDVKRSRESTHLLHHHDPTAVFSSPETVLAYVGRLDTTTLPFAIDAAHVLDIIPPQQETEYVVLDNACGTGAAVEWMIKEFIKAGVQLDITATDHSAVMMNEVTKRRHRLDWGNNVKSIIMDAQVVSICTTFIDVGAEVSESHFYACFHDVWDNVDS
jgi:SAM-dependent methyltransferase